MRGNELIGISVMTQLGDRAYNFFTGVVPGERGKAIARALKIATISRARYEGITAIFTNNLSTNDAIVKLNESLGFERRPGFRVTRKRLDTGSKLAAATLQ